MTLFNKIHTLVLLLFVSFNLFSQPATIVGTVIGEPGDTVMIPIDYIGTGSGVVGFQVDVAFDNATLTLSTANCTDLGGVGVSCTDKGTYVRILVIDFGLNELPSGSMGFLEFTISSGSVIPSVYPLTIISEEYSDAASSSVPPLGSIDGSISVNQLFSIGGTISSLGVSPVTLQNNFTDDLIVSANGSFVFPTKLTNLAAFSVTVLENPTTPAQTCIVSGGTNGDGTGVIATADVTDIQLVCNNSPNVIPDTYTMLEDSVLIADDANGTVNDASDDGVLVNDTDDDVLTIVTPGTFNPIGGIGGLLTINSDGTFNYTSPANVFGLAQFSYEVTDGLNVVASFISINVTPVNDQPSFDDLGNIVSFPFIMPPNNTVSFPNFAHNIDLGPLENLSQVVSHFDLSIVSDTNSILNPINTFVENDGTLTLDLTLNEGVAVMQLILVDDGGVADGGVDTSTVHEFSVSFFDVIFEDEFETITLNKLQQSVPGLLVLGESVSYKSHQLSLSDANSEPLSLSFIKNWVTEINTIETEQ